MLRLLLPRSGVFLVLVLLAACTPVSRFLSVSTPTIPRPSPQPVSIEATAAAVIGVSADPMITPPGGSHAPIDPTIEALCLQSPGINIPDCIMLYVPASPVPDVSFEDAVRQVPNRALLYVQIPGSLLIGDPDSGDSLWINERSCPPHSTRDVSGEWSADGQFVAFLCQDTDYQTTLHLLAMQTAIVRQIAQGDAVAFAWSPTGHRLLITEQTPEQQRTALLDAVTSELLMVPSTPGWRINGYTPRIDWHLPPRGSWYIDNSSPAMAWSPDGSRIVVIAGQQMDVFDADPAQAHENTLARLTTISTWSMHQPIWSDDGRFVYVLQTHQYHDNPMAPSSQFGPIIFRVDVHTGVITEAEAHPTTTLWSPDKTGYVVYDDISGTWTLYQADGTLVRVLPTDISNGPIWMPDSQHILIYRFIFDQFLSNVTQIGLIDRKGDEWPLVTASDIVSFGDYPHTPISSDSEFIAFSIESRYIVVYDRHGQIRAAFVGMGKVHWRGP